MARRVPSALCLRSPFAITKNYFPSTLRKSCLYSYRFYSSQETQTASQTESQTEKFERSVEKLFKKRSEKEVKALWGLCCAGKRKITIDVAARFIYKKADDATKTAAERLLQTYPMYFKKRGSEYLARSTENLERMMWEKQEMSKDVGKIPIFICRARKLLQDRGHSVPDLPPNLAPLYTELEQRKLLNMDEEDQEYIETLKQFAATEHISDFDDEEIGRHSTLGCFNVTTQPESVFEFLVKLGACRPNENLSPLRHGLSTLFPREVEAEAARLVANPLPEPEGYRWDLRHLTVFCIDDLESVEIDDGISVDSTEDGEWVYIHVADPSRWVRPDSLVDKEALRRSRSVYLPELSIPMLPRVMAAAASLTPKRENYALTFAFLILPDGQITNFRVGPSIIDNIRRLSYLQAEAELRRWSTDELLPLDKSLPTDTEMKALKALDSDVESVLLNRLFEISQLRRDYRKQQGANLNNLPSPRVQVEQDGTVVLSPDNQILSASNMVTEFMVAAGEIAAAAALAKKVDIPFRSQEAPVNLQEYFEQQSKAENPNLRAYNSHRFLPEAKRSLNPLPHFGMGVPYYTQVTSPLRRYSDLLVHYQLKAGIQGEKTPFSSWSLLPVLRKLDEQERVMMTVEKETERSYVLRYLEQLVGRSLRATVLSTRPNLVAGSATGDSRATIFLPRIAWQTNISVPKEVEEGSTISVRIASCDPAVGHLSLEYLRGGLV